MSTNSVYTEGAAADIDGSHAGREPELPPPSYLRATCTDEHKIKLRAWQDSRILYTHPLRIRQHATWRKADLFDQSLQWLEKSYNSDPTRTPHWASVIFERDDPDWMPTPTYNRFSAPIENEAARLGKPEYKPYVRPSGERPDINVRTAAKKAEDVVQQSLEDMAFNEQADMGELHMPLYGGWALKSFWDVSWEKTTRVPVLTAQKCPACDFRLSEPDIPPTEETIGLATEKPEAVESEFSVDDKQRPQAKFTAKACLTCDSHEEMEEQPIPVMDPMTGMQEADELGQPRMEMAPVPVQKPGGPKLEPYVPINEELQEQDHFGRDLGQDVQMGEWKVRTVSPYDLFFHDLGVDKLSISLLQEWTEVHVETLEWICNRYENGHMVKPESNQALMQWHPIGGERAIYYSESTSGQGLFLSASRVKETHKKPWREKVLDKDGKPTGKYRMNRGRTVIIASNVILFDGDFMIESKVNKGVLLPRVHLDYAAWKLRSGGRELNGISMSEGIFDAQENINEIKSQTQDARQEEGSPKWLVPRGVEFGYEGGGTAGSRWLYDPLELEGVHHRPERIESKLISDSIYKELESDEAYIEYHANLNEVESGNVPANVAAALALQILAEQSGERRRPRIRRIREMLMRVYKHGLQLMHELVREPRMYFDSDDTEEWKAWEGMDLMGQCDVRIDAEPEHDTAIQEQQTIRDAIEAGVLNPSNPRAARIIAKKLGVPGDLYQEENLQEEAAQREFSDYMDGSREPMVDPDLDQDQAHYEQHGIDCHSEKWRQLEEQSGWDKALVYLTGWETMFDSQQQQAVLGVDPATGQPINGMTTVPGLDQQMGQSWPPAPEIRIQFAWDYILQQYGYQPKPNEVEPLKRVMRFRAHMSAHKRRIAQSAMATQQGAQVVAAPDAPKAQDGTVPVQ